MIEVVVFVVAMGGLAVCMVLGAEISMRPLATRQTPSRCRGRPVDRERATDAIRNLGMRGGRSTSIARVDACETNSPDVGGSETRAVMLNAAIAMARKTFA
jgi:hypothetical protein